MPSLVFEDFRNKSFTLETWVRRDLSQTRPNRPIFGFKSAVWISTDQGPESLQATFSDGTSQWPNAKWLGDEEEAKWFHAALVRDVPNKTIHFYVNGRLVDRQVVKPLIRGQRSLLSFGVPGPYRFYGEIGESRFSSVIRYDRDFTPPTDLKPDKHTIALYKFGEGTGDVLKDSSGNNHHGKIVGAKWVKPSGGDLSNATKIDLLRDHSPEPHSRSAKQSDGTWILKGGDLEFTRQIQGDYRLSVLFNQMGGYDGEMKLLLPVGSSQVELVIPDDVKAKGQAASLNLVDGKPLAFNKVRFWKRRDYLLNAEVKRVGDRWRMTVSLEDKSFQEDQPTITGEFDEQQLSVPETRSPKQSGVIRFGLTDLEIHLKEVDLFGGDLSTASQMPASQPQKATNNERTSLETSLRLSDPDDQVTIPTLKDDTDALTIELWLQRDSKHLNAHDQIVGFAMNTSISTNSVNGLDFQMPGTGSEDGPHDGWNVYGVGQPVHVAGVRDPDKKELRLYYDGKLIQTSPGEIRRGGGTLQIAGNEYQWGKGGFTGWIGPIRISKSVRYTDNFTPQRRFEKDDQTEALYNFDEGPGDILKDSSGNNHHGKIEGAKWVKPQGEVAPAPQPAVLSGNALKFTPGDGVVIDSLKDTTESLTMECWVQPLKAAPHTYLLGTSRDYNLRTGSFQQFGFQSPGRPGSEPKKGMVAGFMLNAKLVDVPSLEMNHIAVVRDPQSNQHRFYLNGQLKGVDSDSYRAPSDGFYICGKTFQYASDEGWGFEGYLDEIRISKSVRYTGDSFQPQSRFEPDADTLALYHCDEIKDGMLLDSSGNNHHGKVTGAKIEKIEYQLDPATVLILPESIPSSDAAATAKTDPDPPKPTRSSSRRKRPKPASAPFTAQEAKKLQKEWAEYLDVEAECTNPLGMKFVLIPPGEFDMGTAQKQIEYLIGLAKQHGEGWEPEHMATEFPQRRVKITKPFYISAHEVTKYAWVYFSTAKIADKDTVPPKPGPGDDFPATNISYDEIVEFCKWFSAGEKKVCRLPTEAEWEDACRAGTETLTAFGDDLSSTQAYFHGGHPLGNAPKGPNLGKATPVGSYPPNAFGLYDMHGNAWEVVNDYWHENTYRLSPNTDPTGPANGSNRVIRGGDYENSRGFAVRSGLRFTYALPYKSVGFRIVLELN